MNRNAVHGSDAKVESMILFDLRMISQIPDTTYTINPMYSLGYCPTRLIEPRENVLNGLSEPSGSALSNQRDDLSC